MVSAHPIPKKITPANKKKVANVNRVTTPKKITPLNKKKKSTTGKDVKRR